MTVIWMRGIRFYDWGMTKIILISKSIRMKFITTLIVTLCAFGAYGQKYASCENALEVCSKESLKFEFNRDTTSGGDLDLPTSCLLDGYPTTWIQWEIVEDGYLTFTLIPENQAEDLDFAVYRLHPKKNCTRKELMRCMMAGTNLGDLRSSLPCLGPTGLSIKEPASNTMERQGCGRGTNNYLAALDCKKGERYVLAIQNFDNSAGGFFLDFCGTAMLPCDSIQCVEFVGRGASKHYHDIVVYNQEVTTDSLLLNLYISTLDPIEVNIRNGEGIVVYHGTVQPILNKTRYGIPIVFLPVGKYALELKTKKRNAVCHFFKAKK